MENGNASGDDEKTCNFLSSGQDGPGELEIYRPLGAYSGTQEGGRTPSSKITVDRRNEIRNMIQVLHQMAQMIEHFPRAVDHRKYRLDKNRSKLTAEEAIEVYECKRRID